ncbi:CaiF/GrlA family transcriptional regulator [Escherichia coli]|uniref:CaiF/GrlA family transcriptional regulator n=1 Tax=Escherichia coli TaxID=562 RepID=UPI000A92CDDC|nr:CaiF/GrlA family transcriptional regulator [Escherichia coli]
MNKNKKMFNDTGQKKHSLIRKKGLQSNHGEYVVPPGMEEWADDPLYLLVARWCWQQKRWVNRNDIAMAFHLPDRRASFQLSYISRKKDRVVCRCRNNSASDIRHHRNEIWVDRILPARPETLRETSVRPQGRPEKTPGATSRKVGNGMTGNTSLWEQMLKRVREEQGDE